MKRIFTGLLLLFSLFSFSQEITSFNKIEDKAVIFFPEITVDQLNSIKAEFLKHDQISSAKYVFGTHNCLLLTFNNQLKEFSVYDELLKTLSPFYNTANCIFKSKDTFTEIETSAPSHTFFYIK